MIPIPAFNILALGLKLITQRLVQCIWDPLFKTLYTASLSMQAFLLISMVCPVYFTDLFSSPPTLLLFSGSAVIVYGTIANASVTNASGTQDPTWECFIGWTLPPMVGAQNNWIFCDGDPAQFHDGPHLLTVNANDSNQQTFWFDQIQYAPSASVSLNQSLLRIDSNDSAIQYSPGGWSFEILNSSEFTSSVFGGTTSSTQTTGATLTYQFLGS